MKITREMLGKVLSTDIVGIMLSGGMDSALLLYLIASTFKNKVVTFTVPKTDGAAIYVNGIIDWVNKKTNRDILYSKLIGNPFINHSAIINNAIKQIKNDYDVLYFAGNSYPDNILPNGPKRTRRYNPKHVQPFFNCYKTDIVRAYIEYDLMELLSLTHTCTEQLVGRCNKCWQCRERIWAFNEVGIIDTSTT